jgi:superoxide dismutase, Cu-Zn family
MKGILQTIVAVTSLSVVSFAHASITIPMYRTAPQGSGARVGTITATETNQGVLFAPQLSGLTPGIHGFHVHQNPNCGDNGMAAGPHWDPDKTNKHEGPYTQRGHLGDLPALTADAAGKVNLSVLAPHLKLADLMDHALIVHAGGDNYSDTPPLGGGGARFICGVVPK